MNAWGLDWGHSKQYNNRLSRSDTGIGGNSVLVPDSPYMVHHDDGTLTVVRGVKDSLWFKQNGSSWDGQNGIRATLDYDSTNKEYSLNTPDGTKYIYYDEDASHGMSANRLKTVKSAGGHEGNLSYDASGKITKFSQTEGSDTVELIYNYYPDGKIEEVIQQINGTKVRRSHSTYYGLGSTSGNYGDLASSAVETWDGTDWQEIRKTCYRYYTTNSATGYIHGLKYVMEPASVQAMAIAGVDPLSASDNDIEGYADYYMEYDSLHRVTKVKLNGGYDEYTYSYTESTLAKDYNNWKTKIVETSPDGATTTVYCNHLFEVILILLTDGSDKWYRYVEFNSQGRAVLMASSAAVVSANTPASNEALDVTLESNEGLIRVKEYYSTTNSNTGAAANYLHYYGVKQGSGGTVIKQAAYNYVEHSHGSHNIFQISKATNFLSDTDATKTAEITYDYTWHTNSLQIEQRTRTLPVVPTTENGAGNTSDPYTTDEVYDSNGRMTWSRNELGIINHTSYEEMTGAMKQSIQDVNTNNTAGAPSGWVTPTDAGKNLVTDYESDNLGRITQTLGPEHSIDESSSTVTIRKASYTVYQDANHEVWSAQGYAKGSSPSYTTVNPVSITKTDAGGRTTEQIEAKHSGSGRLSSSDTFIQSSYLRWTTMNYNTSNQMTWSRVYFDIPSSNNDPGTNGTNYNQTDFGYDEMNRQNKVSSGGNTITRVIYDVRSQVTETWVGTNDSGATDSNPAGSGAPNNMVKVSTDEYDDGNPGGNGLLTKYTQHVDDNSNRVTKYEYDWRNRPIIVDGEENLYTTNEYNNQGQVTIIEQRNGSATATLLGKQESLYDILGRNYRRKAYAVNSSGTVGNALENNIWYSATGQVIKQQNAGSESWTKTVYDSLGRVAASYLSYPENGNDDGNSNNVDNDVVVEQQENSYDNASNITEIRSYQRYRSGNGSDPGTTPDSGTGSKGALNGPNGANPKARIYYQCQWPDGIGRIQANANYGTNGGNTFNRPSTIPASSNTVLVSRFTYDDAGQVEKSIDPQGTVNKIEYDNLGRTAKTIENYINGVTAADTNKTTEYSYSNDGLLETLCCKNSDTGDQTTRWQYGTTTNDSDIASSQLLRAKIYPDSDDATNPLDNGTDGVYDRVEYEYNRLSEIIQKHDQNGTIHQYDHDGLGRIIHDRVTTLGSGVDGSIRRISKGYDDLGRLNTVTSANHPTVGSGSTVNEAKFSYNDFGQLQTDQQAHTGAVTAATPKVSYNYANGSDNTIRPTSISYPDGRQINYNYGSNGSMDDILSRIAEIKDAATNQQLANYSYLGANTPVITNYPQPSVQLSYLKQSGETDLDGDPYNGLDRFGRIQDQRWLKVTTDIERIKYGYTQASLKQWKENTVAANNHDDHYSYDGLYQVQVRQQGNYDQSLGIIGGTPVQEEDFSYDPTGNWNNYTRKANGNTTVNQNRTHTKVNEIKTYLGSSYPVSYDKAGNMVKVPTSETSYGLYQEFTWDAWHRLVKITTPGACNSSSSSSSSSSAPSQQGLDVRYEYDGLTRRTRKTVHCGVNLGTVSYYYNSNWKCVEERQGTATCAERQYIYGVRGRNDLILRDRYQGCSSSSSSSVSNSERYYALSDSMGSVTAITNTAGAVVERYSYTAFGQSQVMNSSFSNRSLSLYDWQTRFHGEPRDAETGYYNYGYRYYLPQLGKWPSRDPIGERGGMNLYGFASNDGVNNIDVLGLSESCTPGDIRGSIGGFNLKLSNIHWDPEWDDFWEGIDGFWDFIPHPGNKWKFKSPRIHNAEFRFDLHVELTIKCERCTCRELQDGSVEWYWWEMSPFTFTVEVLKNHQIKVPIRFAPGALKAVKRAWNEQRKKFRRQQRLREIMENAEEAAEFIEEANEIIEALNDGEFEKAMDVAFGITKFMTPLVEKMIAGSKDLSDAALARLCREHYANTNDFPSIHD